MDTASVAVSNDEIDCTEQSSMHLLAIFQFFMNAEISQK